MISGYLIIKRRLITLQDIYILYIPPIFQEINPQKMIF